MAKITVKRGSEGPEHDPYAYTEITFYFTDRTRAPVTYHGGLAEWTKQGNLKWSLEPAQVFEDLTGLSVRRAEQIPEILFARMLRKHTKEEQWQILECIEADEALLRYVM